MPQKGIYCLILKTDGAVIPVGALGDVTFPAGWYIYVGSALGPGGLARVQRHVRLFHGEGIRHPRWHIDYLLLDGRVTLMGAVCGETTDRLECTLVRRLGGDGVRGFGCSDCRCTSHLLYRDTDPRLECCRALSACGCTPGLLRSPDPRMRQNLVQT